MKFNKYIALSAAFASTAFAFKTPNGVCDFDADRFTGGWFELASSWNVANTIERGCECPVAVYTTNKVNMTQMDVTNSCLRYGQYWKMQGYTTPATPYSGSKG